MISRCFILCLCSFLLISCKSSFTSYKYEPISSLEPFNGTYVNSGDSLSHALGLWSRDVEVVTLKFETPEKLNISYPTDTGIVQITYRGKFKNNYFETYLDKRRLVALVVNSIVTDKVRIGKTNVGSMFIHRTSSSFGNFLIFVGGGDNEYTYTHIASSNSAEQLYPFEENGKWGYRSSLNEAVIIEPQYDFVKLFEDSVARVKLSGKWALINKAGKLLTDYKYNKIDCFYKGIARAYIADKEGYINEEGVEIIPVIYDQIDYLYGDRIARSRLGDKYGYASSYGVIYPPIFDRASEYFNKKSYGVEYLRQSFGEVKIGEDSYYIDDKGYAYKYKSILGLDKKIVEESKIKVSDLIVEELNIK